MYNEITTLPQGPCRELGNEAKFLKQGLLGRNRTGKGSAVKLFVILWDSDVGTIYRW